MQKMSDELYSVLEYIVVHATVVYKNIGQLFGDNAHLVLRLRDMGYVSIKQENPNFWYLLPEALRQEYFVFLTSEGLEAYRLEKAVRIQQAEHEAKEQAEKQAADERWRKDARRSWLQFWLGVLFSCIGFAAGVFVEHYFAVLELIFAIF